MKTIKTTLRTCLFVALAWAGHAQGTFEFTAYLHGTNVVPPSQLPYTGTGAFTLSGTTFGYEVRTGPLSFFDAAIYGPAGSGSNGPMLFSLRFKEGVPPLPPSEPGYALWQGTATISSAQSQDLIAGLWYVQIVNQAFPDRAMRGQIVLVPEPNVAGLLFLGASLLGLVSRFKGCGPPCAASRFLVPHRFNSTNQTSSIP